MLRATHKSAFHENSTSPISAFHPLRALDAQAIRDVVRVSDFLDVLSKRAPIIVVLTLCAALVGAWSSAPLWLVNGLAIIVAILAVVLLVTRGRRNEFKAPEELASTRLRDWIAYELAGKGSPPGFYLLGFFGFITIFVTGLQSTYSRPAWAGFFLGIVWGIANARYPAKGASGR